MGLESRWFAFAHVLPRKGWWALGMAFKTRKLGDKARPEAERAVPRGGKAFAHRGRQGRCGAEVTALRLRVNPDTWYDRRPSWHSWLLVPVAALQGPVTRACPGGQGVPQGWTLPTPCPRKSPWRKGECMFSVAVFLVHLALILATRVDGAHLTDGEGHVSWTLS